MSLPHSFLCLAEAVVAEGVVAGISSELEQRPNHAVSVHQNKT